MADAHQTIGQQFKAAREARGLDLRTAAERTKIMARMLAELEEDDFRRMPAPVYAKGFIRIYAEFLGLAPAPLVEEYEACQTAAAVQPVSPPARPVRTLKLPHPPWRKLFPIRFNAEKMTGGMTLSPKVLRLTAAGILGLALLLALVVGMRRCSASRPAPVPEGMEQDWLIGDPGPVYLLVPGRVVDEEELRNGGVL